MNIYVLRHGVAEERDIRKYPDDLKRPLTRRGRRKLARQVKGMNSIKLAPDLIITSPLVRAVQTAKAVQRGLNAPTRLITSAALVPSAHPSLLLDELAASHSSAGGVMVVGHEPHLSSLISFALTGSISPIIRLKKGALCNLKLLPSGSARLIWALTPKHMAAMA